MAQLVIDHDEVFDMMYELVRRGIELGMVCDKSEYYAGTEARYQQIKKLRTLANIQNADGNMAKICIAGGRTKSKYAKMNVRAILIDIMNAPEGQLQPTSRVITGSGNLTFNGISSSEEWWQVITDPQYIEETKAAMKKLWTRASECGDIEERYQETIAAERRSSELREQRTTGSPHC